MVKKPLSFLKKEKWVHKFCENVALSSSFLLTLRDSNNIYLVALKWEVTYVGSFCKIFLLEIFEGDLGLDQKH